MQTSLARTDLSQTLDCAPMALIQAGQLRPLIESREQSLVILDCRFDLKDPSSGERLYEQGHIPQAIYVHLDRDLCGPLTSQTGRHPIPSVEDLSQKFSSWGITSGVQVICYDGGDLAFAARAWWLLKWLGHETVSVLDGGYKIWTDMEYEVSTNQPVVRPQVFRARVNQAALVQTEQVVKGISPLIDVRDPQRFRGEVEPIDPVAGHIPGAQNLFFKELMNSNGLLKSPVEIQKILKPYFKNDSPVFYCGSGVTACVALLAAEEASLLGARLYGGSWSEWIRDPSRGTIKNSL